MSIQDSSCPNSDCSYPPDDQPISIAASANPSDWQKRLFAISSTFPTGTKKYALGIWTDFPTGPGAFIGSTGWVDSVTINPQYTVTFYTDPTSGTITADSVTKTYGVTGTYVSGSRVHVIANPPSGYSFSYWEPGGVSVDSTSSADTYMTVSNNGWLRAHFTPFQYTISVNTSPSGLDSPTGGGTFNQGYSDPISVGNVNGYTFEYWNRDGSLYTYSQSFYYGVDGSYTFTAVFQRNQYRVDDCCWCGWDDDSFAWYVSALCWGSYLGFVFDYEFRVYFCWLDC